jgi:hypothetical protein
VDDGTRAHAAGGVSLSEVRIAQLLWCSAMSKKLRRARASAAGWSRGMSVYVSAISTN